MALLQGECDQLLTATDQKGFIQLPLCAGGHWTLLTFHRRPEQPKLQVMYRDALPKLHEACLKKAKLAMQLMTEVLGSANLSGKAVPDRTPDHQQHDCTACGFYMMAFMGQDYRLLRGEGIFKVSVNWREKAVELEKLSLTSAEEIWERDLNAILDHLDVMKDDFA